MARSRTNRTPALAAAAALHGAVLALALISWQWSSRHLKLGQVVPVEIVNGPPADMAPAIQAPEPSPATVEQPTPDAVTPPTPPAPPQPTPAPPQPAAQSKQAQPQPQPTPPKPVTRGQGKPAAKPLDLSALARSLAHAKSPSRDSFSLDRLASSITKQAQGAKGPDKPRTAAQAETGHGTQDHLSASDVNGLVTKLQRLWNPNCDVEGAAGINVKVRIRFNRNGTLNGPPELMDRSIDPSGAGLLSASAHRALSAVVRGAPYDELPADAYGDWKDMVVNFNAKQACARR
jgi:outer membrane biosynthesis protein TonB